jgi:hypothetical protein
MERDAVRRKVEALGYTVTDLELENGCYAVEVRDRNGNELDLYLDPVSNPWSKTRSRMSSR